MALLNKTIPRLINRGRHCEQSEAIHNREMDCFAS